MDLETKYYDLQDKYHHLINEYEKLKAKHEVDNSGCWVNLTEEELKKLLEDETKQRGVSWMGDVHVIMVLLAAQDLLKVKNEKNCFRHRDKLGSRYDTPSGDSGR